jgi:hypothetical protein
MSDIDTGVEMQQTHQTWDRFYSSPQPILHPKVLQILAVGRFATIYLDFAHLFVAAYLKPLLDAQTSPLAALLAVAVHCHD